MSIREDFIKILYKSTGDKKILECQTGKCKDNTMADYHKKENGDYCEQCMLDEINESKQELEDEILMLIIQSFKTRGNPLIVPQVLMDSVKKYCPNIYEEVKRNVVINKPLPE